MQQVDLKLTDAHFMHNGVTGQTQRRHARIHLAEEWPQAVVGTDAERSTAVFASTVQANGRAKGLSRVGIGRKDKKLQLGRHHRRQPMRSVTGNHSLELATGRQG